MTKWSHLVEASSADDRLRSLRRAWVSGGDRGNLLALAAELERTGAPEEAATILREGGDYVEEDQVRIRHRLNAWLNPGTVRNRWFELQTSSGSVDGITFALVDNTQVHLHRVHLSEDVNEYEGNLFYVSTASYDLDTDLHSNSRNVLDSLRGYGMPLEEWLSYGAAWRAVPLDAHGSGRDSFGGVDDPEDALPAPHGQITWDRVSWGEFQDAQEIHFMEHPWANNRDPNAHPVHVDVDDHYGTPYIGSTEDGWYIGTGHRAGGWYWSSVIDSDTGSFVGPGPVNQGPYDDQDDALEAGTEAARDWFFSNNLGDDGPEAEEVIQAFRGAHPNYSSPMLAVALEPEPSDEYSVYVWDVEEDQHANVVEYIGTKTDTGGYTWEKV